MGVYIKGELPKQFNGITMKEAISLADEYLENNSCDRMWDAIRALRDFCECVTDEAVAVKTPHGRLIDAEVIKDSFMEKVQEERLVFDDEHYFPTVIESEVE